MKSTDSQRSDDIAAVADGLEASKHHAYPVDALQRLSSVDVYQIALTLMSQNNQIKRQLRYDLDSALRRAATAETLAGP